MEKKFHIYEYTLKRQRVSEIRESDAMSMTGPEECEEFLRVIGMDELDQEHLVVIMLNCHRTVVGYQTVSVGTRESCPCSVKDIFRAAIIQGAHSIVLAHNHPSGKTKPSEADFKLTEEVNKAGDILGIPLIDHIIIGDDVTSIGESKPETIGIDPKHQKEMLLQLMKMMGKDSDK